MIDKDKLAVIRRNVRAALPKGWRVRIHKYLSNGVRVNVYAAPADLLGDLKKHGLNLNGSMHFECNGTYAFNHYMTPPNGWYMQKLYDAAMRGNHGDYDVYMAVGSKDDPFLHIVKPPKWEHPYLAALKKINAENAEKFAKADAKALIPAKALKNLKKAHHTWA